MSGASRVRASGLLLALAVLGGSVTASAQTPAPSPPRAVRSGFGARLDGLLGVSAGEVSGPTYGAGFYLHYWVFQVGGIFASAQGGIFDLNGTDSSCRWCTRAVPAAA